MTASGMDLVLVGLAGAAAGAVNAFAGGGTLITFPALMAAGIPAVPANVTNTVAVWPGYLGAALAQRADLRGQQARLWMFVPAAAAGGVVGAILLLHTGERVFRALVPFLILFASGLLAVQEPLRAWIARRSGRPTPEASWRWAVLPVGLGAIYSGYFGAGASVILLAVLGLLVDDSLIRLNALKQTIAFSSNIAASSLFVLSGPIAWPAALAMTAGAVAGGLCGGRLAGRMRPGALRWFVVAIGVAVALVYLARS